MKKNTLSLLVCAFSNYDEVMNVVNNGTLVELGNDYPFLEDLLYSSDQTGNHLLGVFKDRLTLNQNLYLLFSFYNKYVVEGENTPQQIKQVAEEFTEYMRFVGLNSLQVEDIIDVGTRYIEDKVDNRIFYYSNKLSDITYEKCIDIQAQLDKGFNELDIIGSVEYIEKTFKDEISTVDSSVIDKIDLNDIRVNSVEQDEASDSTEDVINKFNKEYSNNKIISRIMEQIQQVLQENLKNLKGDDD